MTLEDFLSRLDGVRRSAGGHVARCPAHEDSTPSLSITRKSNRILVYCFAGCRAEEVCQSMGLTLSDLFEDDEGTGLTLEDIPF